MKILNLYACLGGNRLLWDDCEVTAVELDPELARLYQERFPNDTVIVADAHQYLLEHYREFDFIWSSPPCPSHSRANFWSSKGIESRKRIFPDMKLYEEVLFLQHYAKDGLKWVVENVVPYYEPLIKAQKVGRHLYWSNFKITPPREIRKVQICQGKNEINNLCEFHKYDFRKYKGEQRLNKIARNLVDYEIGKHIFDIARGSYKANNTNQGELF
jgi:DNA (cytosine-5)-methyltransferase 1